MEEYIEREALVKLMVANFRQGSGDGCDYPMYPVVEETIMDAPAADVAPVRHGRWKLVGADKRGRGGNWECTGRDGCGKSYPYRCDYCPNCGALMKEAEHEAN